METVLSCLRADAAGWWYHRQLRQQGQAFEAIRRERESIRSRAMQMREALVNGGWLQIGRCGAMLHTSRNAHTSGLHAGFIRACIIAGVPTMDSNGVDFDDVWELAVNGPMPGFEDSTFGTNPDGSLSTRHWSTIFNRYAARPGAVFWNYTPTPEPWTPAAKPARRGIECHFIPESEASHDD